MSLTIVLSGPKVAEQQVRNALTAAGFGVQAHDHDYGLPPIHVEKKRAREAHSFVTVEGNDVDKATETVGSLGWRLRMHHETPEPKPPSTEQLLLAKLAELELKVADLTTMVAQRGDRPVPNVRGLL